MLISSVLLANSFQKHKEYKKQKENYSGWQSSGAGISAGFVAFYMVIAMLFFLMELLLVIYAVFIAINCTRGGPERIVHIVLAVIFTLPYVLLNVFFSSCAQNTLRGNVLFPSFNKK